MAPVWATSQVIRQKTANSQTPIVMVGQGKGLNLCQEEPSLPFSCESMGAVRCRSQLWD